MSRYQKGKTNLDFTEARDSEWLWHQLGHMQDCTSLQTDNHASTPPLSFSQAGCPSCRPTNSVKALKAFKALKAYLLVYHKNKILSLYIAHCIPKDNIYAGLKQLFDKRNAVTVYHRDRPVLPEQHVQL